MKNIIDGQFTIFNKVPKHGTVKERDALVAFTDKLMIAIIKVCGLMILVSILRFIANKILEYTGASGWWMTFLFNVIPSFVSIVLLIVSALMLIKAHRIIDTIHNQDWLVK